MVARLMTRSFTNRIFGGVCGGLGRAIPLNATLWRVLFILLTLVTGGVGALVYLLWWWMLPQHIPGNKERGSALLTLLALLLGAALIGGWLVRDQLVGPGGADLFGPAALLLLALVLLVKQIGAPQGSVIGGLVLMALPVVLLLAALEVIPPGIGDLLARAAPVLLIFFGLIFALRDRMRFSGLLALIVSGALVGGVATVAYTSRLNEQRTDNRITYEEAVAEAVNLLQIDVETLDTDVEFFAAPAGERSITARYTGSNAAELVTRYEEADSGLATLRLEETLANPFPLLEDVGRSALRLELPQDVAVSVSFAGERGTTTFDMDDLNLERLNIDLDEGDALVTLPAYQPLSPTVQENPGRWQINNGDLTVRVPEDAGVRFALAQASNRQPLPGDNYDDLFYVLQLSGVTEWVLLSQGYEGFDVRLDMVVNVPRGDLRVVRVESDPDR